VHHKITHMTMIRIMFRMKWKKEHKMASMNAMPMHQMHPALAYGHHPHLQVLDESIRTLKGPRTMTSRP
jgi:hypothetical protein